MNAIQTCLCAHVRVLGATPALYGLIGPQPRKVDTIRPVATLGGRFKLDSDTMALRAVLQFLCALGVFHKGEKEMIQ